MSFTGKYKKYLLAIFVLSLTFVIKSHVGYENKEQESDIANDDLSIKHYMLNTDTGIADPITRDIFSAGNQANTREIHRRAVNRGDVRMKTINHNQPAHTINQTKASNADGEIDRLKLLGIVFHGQKKQAFLAWDRQRVIANVGDLVYGRYLLREIAVDSATFVDTNDNLQKIIIVSGK